MSTTRASSQPTGPPHPPAPSPTEGGRGDTFPSPPHVRGGACVAGGDEREPDRWRVPEGMRRSLRDAARINRKRPTASEEILWTALRGKHLDGLKFRRQHPVGPFVLDFFCAERRVAVEIDGGIHDQQLEADLRRQEAVERLGITFVRIPARMVERDLEESLDLIRAATSPPPRGRGGARAAGGGEGIAPRAKTGGAS
jgi:very-short-patch-repair endonuclease